jgi:hypothetical protein
VRKWKDLGEDPVSSDSFSRFADGAAGSSEHNKNATAMTKFMFKTCVPAAAAALDRSDTEPVSVLLHREGVNVRHLDKLLMSLKKSGPLLKTPAARMLVARDMLERTIKNLLRRGMRDVITRGGSISELLELAAVTFNCVTSAEVGAEVYWAVVREGARERFGGTNLDKFLDKVSQEVAESKTETQTAEAGETKSRETPDNTEIKGDAHPISEEEIEAKWEPFSRTNMQVCRASPGTMVLRVAEDVGIELTATCATDLCGGSGDRFAFNSADVARLVPRIKYLDILNKAEGMALAGRLGERVFDGSGGGGNDSDEGEEAKGDGKEDIATHIATRLRLLGQAASKLRIAACGVFPDREVATKLAEVRLEQLNLEPNDKTLLEIAKMAFDELRAFPHDEESVDKEAKAAQRAVDLACALLDNPNLKAEDGVNVLLDGLVKNRVGSSVKPPAQLMAPDVRATLGDNIVTWGIEHGDWGRDEEEKEKRVVEMDAFVNGPLATLVGCGADAADAAVVEAKEGGGGEQEEEKEGKCDNNIIQSVACGDGGRDDMTKAREWIATKMVVVTLKEFALCVGLTGGADGDIKDGVEFDKEGYITKIDWKRKNLNRNLDRLGDVLKRMPRLQVLDLGENKGLTGVVDKLVLSVGMQEVNFEGCEGLTASPGCPRGSSYNFSYNEDDLNRLRSWISLTATQGGAAGEDGNEGKAGGDGEGATEMETLRAFAESVGYKVYVDGVGYMSVGKVYVYDQLSCPKTLLNLATFNNVSGQDRWSYTYGDIMDGVVTECAGGAIEEIHWRKKHLDGSLPVGDLNMPKLRVLDLSLPERQLTGAVDKLLLPEGMQSVKFQQCKHLTGDLTQWHLPVGMQNLDLSKCKGVTGDIGQINLPVGMQTVNFDNCEGVTGDIGQMNLTVGMQSVNFFNCKGVTGDLTQWHLPVGMKDLNLSRAKVTGAVDKIVLPEGMQSVEFGYCYGLTGDPTQWLRHLPVGMKYLNLYDTNVTDNARKTYNSEDLDALSTKARGVSALDDVRGAVASVLKANFDEVVGLFRARGDGHITQDDLEHSGLLPGVSSAHLSNFFELLSLNDDGAVEYREFLAACQTIWFKK